MSQETPKEKAKEAVQIQCLYCKKPTTICINNACLNDDSEYKDDDRSEDASDDSKYDDEDDIENAISECGQIRGGGCMLAGTEYCDWECPFSKSMYANASRNRDEKGRYCK